MMKKKKLSPSFSFYAFQLRAILFEQSDNKKLVMLKVDAAVSNVHKIPYREDDDSIKKWPPWLDPPNR